MFSGGLLYSIAEVANAADHAGLKVYICSISY